MTFKSSLSLAIAAFIFSANAIQPRSSKCAAVSGSFNITSPALYPESADWDSVNCKLYLSSLYNQTALQYDPYSKEQHIITFPGISGNASYHIAGVTYDSRTGHVYFDASSAKAFGIGDLTGPNALIKYDPNNQSIVYIAKMESIVSEILHDYDYSVGGFQDIATDLAGNAYQVASFGNSIVKVTPDGTPSIFYPIPLNAAKNTTTQPLGWSGLFSYSNLLILIDSSTGYITTFDTTAPTEPYLYASPKQRYLPSNLPNTTYFFDRFYAPPRFNGTVALASNDGTGTVVLRSLDGWQSAEYVGQVLDDKTKSLGGFGTATVQIADSLFETFEFFGDGELGGERDIFPLVDITNEVLALL